MTVFTMRRSAREMESEQMYKIGLSNIMGDTEDIFKSYSDAGLEYMEISLGKERSDVLDFERVKEYSERHGVKIWSFHLPFMPFNVIDISKEELKDFSVEYLSKLIEKGAGIGIDKFIIHPSGEPIAESEREKRLENAKESLRTLCDVAGKYGATIAVENLPRTCLGRDSFDILELLSADERLRCCFDTNHLLGEDALDFIKKIGHKIITIHVSDYDFKNERHWICGEGLVNWQEIISALKEIDYKGIWLYEVDLATPWTINRERALTYTDFVKNAKELFEGKNPAPFGTPIDGLKKWNE